MAINTIRDIYAGMPDAKDEINTAQGDKFLPALLSHQDYLLTIYSTEENF